MTAKVPNERRRRPRVAADLDMKLDLPGHRATARLRDISTSGVRCLTDRPMPVMTQVRLVLVIPLPASRDGREIVCGGAVVRSAPAPSAGTPAHRGESGGGLAAFDTAIFFTDMNETDRADVEAFVSRMHGSNARDHGGA